MKKRGKRAVSEGEGLRTNHILIWRYIIAAKPSRMDNCFLGFSTLLMLLPLGKSGAMVPKPTKFSKELDGV